MSTFSNYLELQLLDHITRNGSFTMPATVFFGLNTASPGETGTGASSNETSGTSYARANASAIFGTPAASGAIANDAALTFAAAGSGGWGTVTHFAAYDAETVGTGNMLYFGSITSKTIAENDVVEFAIGDIDITLD